MIGMASTVPTMNILRISVMVALAAVLGFVGVQSVVAATQPKPTAKAMTTSVFLQLVRGAYWQLSDAADGDLIEAGKGVCGMFDKGWNTDYIYDVMYVDGLGADNGLSLVRWSVNTFCVGYAGEVR